MKIVWNILYKTMPNMGRVYLVCCHLNFSHKILQNLMIGSYKCHDSMERGVFGMAKIVIKYLNAPFVKNRLCTYISDSEQCTVITGMAHFCRVLAVIEFVVLNLRLFLNVEQQQV